MNKYNHIIVLAILVFISATIYQWLSLRKEAVKASNKILDVTKQNTLVEAKHIGNALKVIRGLYTKQLPQHHTTQAKKFDSLDILDTHAYFLPQFDSEGQEMDISETFGTDIARQMSSDSTTVELFSSYPFPWRKRSLSDAQNEALVHFKKYTQKDTFFHVFNDKKKLLYYVIPDKMQSQTCVNCHNSHPQTQKNNWKIDEMAGAISITIPYQEIQEIERLKLTDKVSNQGVIAISLGAIVVALTAFFLRTRVTDKSVKELQTVIRNIETGKLEEINVHGRSLTLIAHSLQLFIRHYQIKTEFAQQVGNGDFNAKMPLMNDTDVLALSLVEMQEKLKRYVSELHYQTEELQNQRDKIHNQNKYLLELTDKMIENEKVLTESFLTIKDKQKIIEEKNKLITESIKQAFTIQQAILPTQEELGETFKDFFTIYRPKDIVSGDFFWLFRDKRRTYFAVVDCTGHGVPGGFMAMLGIAYLNEIVLGTDITSPDRVLEELDIEVRQSLRQEQNTNLSGMDISLCVYDKETQKLTFAGANLPIYVLENQEIKIIKGTHKLIGGRERKKKRRFKNQEIPLTHTTLIYMATDGFIDQNNNQGNRLGTPAFTELLKKIAPKDGQPLSEVKAVLRKEIDNYRGEMEQRDDITIAGVIFH